MKGDMCPTKREIMTANRFKQELLLIKKAIEEADKIRKYQDWKEAVDKRIDQINAAIRATNKL